MDVALLFRAHQDALFRYLARFSGDAEIAQDAVQETFLRIQERPPGHDSNVRAWLFAVATNVVRDTARRRARRQALLEERPGHVPLADAPADPASAVELEQRRSLVRQALAQLSERERTTLLMREEGFTHREIAEAVGTTTKSVGSLIARSLEKLAARLPLDAEDI